MTYNTVDGNKKDEEEESGDDGFETGVKIGEAGVEEENAKKEEEEEEDASSA